MEAALLLALLGYGAHQMIGHPEVVEEPQANVIYSTQQPKIFLALLN